MFYILYYIELHFAVAYTIKRLFKQLNDIAFVSVVLYYLLVAQNMNAILDSSEEMNQAMFA
jgi:hypothetical protein